MAFTHKSTTEDHYYLHEEERARTKQIGWMNSIVLLTEKPPSVSKIRVLQPYTPRAFVRYGRLLERVKDLNNERMENKTIADRDDQRCKGISISGCCSLNTKLHKEDFQGLFFRQGSLSNNYASLLTACYATILAC